MIEQEIQRKIEDFRAIGFPPYYPREGNVHLVDGTISTIIGARRSGKSYRALQVADELIKAGMIKSLRHVCLLDFDNPILSKMEPFEIKMIPETFLKISQGFGLNTPIIFIFDEIHKIKGFEEGVVDLSRNSNWKIVITGSSSKLLKNDIATELRGKTVSTIMYPLSFAEFLDFKKFDKATAASTKGQAETKHFFDEYLKWGAYPAIARTEEGSKAVLLREYFDTMILRDIIQRYNVSKPKACIQACNYLMSNISRPATSQSVYNYLKESGFSTSRNSVRDYTDWASDSWFLFFVKMFSKSNKEQERNYKKTYCIDWGLARQNSNVWDGSFSRSFENMIFIHLVRRYARVHYYLTKTKRQEVDFIALNDRGCPELAVQVCLDISQKETLRREIDPLITSAKFFGIKENLLLTLGQEKIFRENGVTVHALPAWRWLLK